MVLIDKAALLNKIATEVHYDSEHSLEMYAKMLSLINDAPEVVRCKDCENWVENEHCLAWAYEYSDADGYCYHGKRREDAKTKADRNGFVKQDDLFPQG